MALVLIASWLTIAPAAAVPETASEPADDSGEPTVDEASNETADGETEPLWEWRLAVFTRYGESYPASEDSQFNIIPFPLPVFRGKILRIGEDSQSPIRGRLFRANRIKLDFAFDLNFPVDSGDVDARTDMPDLDFLVELGPELEIEFARNRAGGDWFISLQLRPAVSFDELSPDFRGTVFSPELSYKRKVSNGRSELKFRLAPSFANSRYMDFFYTVKPAFATPQRPAFEADGGYLGTDFTTTWRSKLKNNDFEYVLGTRLSFYKGAKNDNSPLFTEDTTIAFFGALLWKFWEGKTQVPVTE